jgi:hypothetical protein
VIRLALVALAAIGAVWISDDLAGVWNSEEVTRRRVEVGRWLRDRSILPDPAAGPAEPAQSGLSGRLEARAAPVQVEPPPEFPAAPPVEAEPTAAPPRASRAPEPLGAHPAPAVAPAASDAPPPDDPAPAQRLDPSDAERIRGRLGRAMGLAGRSGR